jgi:uncharacterized protein YjbJ (UPF0337 family)
VDESGARLVRYTGDRFHWPPALQPEASRSALVKSSTTGAMNMDKDRIAGSAKQVKGALEEAAGKVLGDVKLVAEGQHDKAVGKVQNAAGGVRDALKDVLKK